MCAAQCLPWQALTLCGEGSSHQSPWPVRCRHASARAAATQGGVLCLGFCFPVAYLGAQQPSHVVRCAPLDGVCVCMSGGGRPMFLQRWHSRMLVCSYWALFRELCCDCHTDVNSNGRASRCIWVRLGRDTYHEVGIVCGTPFALASRSWCSPKSCYDVGAACVLHMRQTHTKMTSVTA